MKIKLGLSILHLKNCSKMAGTSHLNYCDNDKEEGPEKRKRIEALLEKLQANNWGKKGTLNRGLV